MHGVKRTKDASAATTPPLDPAAIAEEKARFEEYKLLNSTLLSRHAVKQYSEPDSLPLSAAVLTLNPEHVTAWSFRRHCLLALRSLTTTDENAQFNQALSKELPLTLSAFERNPKAYPIWEHRKWVLNQMPASDWNTELKLLGRLLKLDGRNFHAWDYRRHIISKLKEHSPSPTPAADELKFSAEQIEANFSNFSAWHYRSKLLEAKLAQQSDAADERRERILAKELEWVRGALWIDPNDQSAWLYHRWLITQTTNAETRAAEFGSIKELLELEPDSKWALTALLRDRPEKCQAYLDRLLTLDPLRKQRYLDLASGLLSSP